MTVRPLLNDPSNNALSVHHGPSQAYTHALVISESSNPVRDSAASLLESVSSRSLLERHLKRKKTAQKSWAEWRAAWPFAHRPSQVMVRPDLIQSRLKWWTWPVCQNDVVNPHWTAAGQLPTPDPSDATLWWVDKEQEGVNPPQQGYKCCGRV